MVEEQTQSVEPQNISADQAAGDVLGMLFGGEQKPLQGEVLPPEKEDAAPAEEMDFFEFPPETEGGEARRVPIDEVIGGYNKAQTLEQELQQARAEFAKAGLLPQDQETAMRETLAQRQALEHTMTVWLSQMVPQRPDPALGDPNSEKYDPELYVSQHRAFEKGVAAYREAKAKVDENRKAMTSEEQALQRSALIREQQSLVQKWPEIVKPEVQRQVHQFALKEGYTESELASMTDHRHYVTLKKAMAFEALDAQQKAAVKAVAAKPKLIRSGASNGAQSRNPANGQFSASSLTAFSNGGGTAMDAAALLLGMK